MMRGMTDLGYDVLDVHHHVGDAFTALGGSLDPTGGMAPEEYERVELESRLAIMDDGGVQQAVVIPGHGYLRPEGIADTRRVNDAIAAYRDRCPERFPVAIGIVEPQHGAALLDEIDRIDEDLGLRGVSFHTRFQGVSLDSQWIARAVDRLESRRHDPGRPRHGRDAGGSTLEARRHWRVRTPICRSSRSTPSARSRRPGSARSSRTSRRTSCSIRA